MNSQQRIQVSKLQQKKKPCPDSLFYAWIKPEILSIGNRPCFTHIDPGDLPRIEHLQPNPTLP